MCTIFLYLVVPLVAAQVAPNGTIVASAPAYYPRGLVTADGRRFIAAERPTASERRIALLEWQVGAWVEMATIVSDADPTADLANAFLFQEPLLSRNVLLCAYRHHTGGSSEGSPRIFRIAISRSVNGGTSWSPLSIPTATPTGVWEPFLFRSVVSPPSVLRLLYAAEITNGGEQDIVEQQSTDGGVSWSQVMSRVHTPGSRNGMPGLVELPDESLLMVFEGFGAGVWDWYTVNQARSFDGGATWSERQVIHQPPFGYDSGSPQVALCPTSTKVCVIYMSNEQKDTPSSQWPDGAHIAASCVGLSTNRSAPLSWNTSTPTIVPTLTPTAYWPGFAVDLLLVNDSPLTLTYQTRDGSAAAAQALFC